MIFAVTKGGQEVYIHDDASIISQPLFCPECGCEVTPAALQSKKVRAYFRAVSSHKDGCVFQARILTPEQEAAKNRLDMTRVWNRMFRADKPGDSSSSAMPGQYALWSDVPEQGDHGEEQNRQQSNRMARPFSRASVPTSLDRDYFTKAIFTLYKMCLNKRLTDRIGENMIKEIFCGERTAHIYKTYISGKKLVECSFLSYDKEKRLIFYRYPAGNDHGLLIRAKFWYTEDFKQAVQDSFSHKDVVLLFSQFSTPGKYIQTTIRTLNQIAYVEVV